MGRYLICLQLPEDISEEISKFQLSFKEKYHAQKALHTPPHITLAGPFEINKEIQELREWIEPLAHFNQVFKVEIENFSSFQESRVIYAKVNDSAYLKTFQRDVLSRIKKLKPDNLILHPRFTPHITIAFRDIPIEKYEEAEIDYLEKHYRGVFVNPGFYLWKHTDHKWESVHYFPFKLQEKPMNFIEFVDSPVGILKIEASMKDVTALKFVESKGENFSNSITNESSKQLGLFFQGKLKEFTLPTKPRGTEFQCNVWGSLQKIPFGNTLSYLSFSKKIGDENAIRAVASANSKNPIPIIIPCHRVIGSKGELTGYLGGLEKKDFLLRFEQKMSGFGQGSLF